MSESEIVCISATALRATDQPREVRSDGGKISDTVQAGTGAARHGGLNHDKWKEHRTRRDLLLPSLVVGDSWSERRHQENFEQDSLIEANVIDGSALAGIVVGDSNSEIFGNEVTESGEGLKQGSENQLAVGGVGNSLGP
jgi:hypothetical protein